jgi:hypothetical protein
MTRDRKLKKAIRTRAKKTGESYAAARRQYLKPARAADVPAPTTPRRGMTDAVSLKATGQPLDHWFRVLDAFSQGRKDHTAAVRHLYDDHHVPGWYGQGITNAWERLRHGRVQNQTCNGDFSVSVSRVVEGGVAAVAAAVADRARRARWLAQADPALVRALAAALDGGKSKGLKQASDARARLRFKWDGHTIELRVDAKAGGKTSVVADNMELPDLAAVEARRAAWRGALDGLRAYLASPR